MRHIIIGIFLLLIPLFFPKVEAYTYKDCEVFILPYLSHSHYTECLKNPSAYSQYYVYYTVNFTSDGSTLKSQSVRRGESASAPATPTKTQHTFNGWDRGFTNVQSNLTVQATWIRSQQVTFLDYNGTTLKIQFVAQGASATPPSVQARQGYEFTGWNGTYTNVMQDVTVMATYQVLEYLVTFFLPNGDVYQTATVVFGGSVTPPLAPVQVGKTFTQWSVSTTNVQSTLSVYPEYEVNRYLVRFYDETQIIKEQLVEHGLSALAPTMNKEGHIFAGWSQPFSSVTQSMDVQASWTKQLFDVYFYHPNGELLSHQSIPYEESVTPPVYSPSEGIQFVGWDQDLTSIVSELHVRPIEERAVYQVYFMDEDNLLLSQQVLHGESCELFSAVKEGHDFTGWDKGCSEVTSELTLRAMFSPHQYDVLFYDFLGAVVKEERVNHGQAATAPEPDFPNYRFTGWNESFDQVTSNLVVRPLGELRTYQAVFKNYEGTTLCTRIVSYNELVSCPAPIKIGHTFTGWSESLNIKNDITIFAQFEPILFQVDFYVDNILAKSEQVRYNFDATPPPVNLQEYDFTRWDGNYTRVTSNQRVDAVITRREYVVVFKVDETTIKEMKVNHGQDAIPPVTAIKKGHTFTGWDDGFTNITTHRAIQATFTPINYKITFIVQGSPYDVTEVEYMSTVTPPDINVVGYELLGWRGELEQIEEDGSVYAILRPITYLVTFLDDGEVLHEEEVAHGESATPPDAGPWDQSFTLVTKSMTIQRLSNDSLTTSEDQPSMTEPTVLSMPTIEATQSVQGDTYRYTFGLDLADYELIDVTIGGQQVSDLSMMTFQSTNIFRREVRWFEIENPAHEPVEFYLRDTQTLEMFIVIPEPQINDNVMFPEQVWLFIVSFFQRFLP
jgi:hypothetical protein